MSLFNYECDEVKRIIEEVSPNYPQLTTYEKEWIYFYKYGYIPGVPVDLEYQEVIVKPTGTVQNAIPFSYKSAILKGSTKYRDIDTGDILDTFDETKNLELVSVKMPVLTTTGKNLFDDRFTTISNYDDQLYSRINLNKIMGNNRNFTISIQQELNSKGKIWLNLYIDGTAYSNLIVNGGTSGHSYRFSLNEKNNVELGIYCEGISKEQALEIIKNNFKIQLEEGSVATSYEPYKSNILTVNEDVTLRSNGNICDELNLLTGQLTQRIDEDGEVLSQEVVKTVDLTTLTNPYEGTNNYHLTANIPCEAILEVPVVSTGEQTISEINNY